MTIYVDNRESPNIIEEGRKIFSDLEVKQLPVADVVKGRCAVERKSARDFAASLNDGRYANQLIHMKANFEFPIYIITGSYEDVANSRYANTVPPQRFEGAIDDLKLIHRIPVFEVSKSRNEKKFWQKCESIFRKVGREPETTVTRVKKYKGNNVLACLTGIEGLGLKHGRAILKQFPTIRSICDASVEDLTTVSGIGVKRARVIKGVFK